MGKVLFILIEQQADVGFSKKSIPFAHYIKKLSINVRYMWLAKSINKWVEGMAVKEALGQFYQD